MFWYRSILILGSKLSFWPIISVCLYSDHFGLEQDCVIAKKLWMDNYGAQVMILGDPLTFA